MLLHVNLEKINAVFYWMNCEVLHQHHCKISPNIKLSHLMMSFKEEIFNFLVFNVLDDDDEEFSI